MLLDAKVDGVFSPQAGIATAFIVGVLSHVFLFRLGEWDLATLKLIGLFLLALAGNVVLTLNSHALPVRMQPPDHDQGLGVAFWVTTALAGALLGGIFSSMLVYRGFLHRLGRFPGPFFARFSGLYMTLRGGRKMQTFREVQKLHEKYGDVVRVGKHNTALLSLENWGHSGNLHR
jgi:membrane protein YqaA with SNARE-associated domain